jgi:dsRNA-specific ribonuclease
MPNYREQYNLRSRSGPEEMTITSPTVVHPSSLPALPNIRDDTLRRQVFTHSSAVSTSSPVSNERLAVLGDAYLAAAVTKVLFDLEGHLKAGEINEIRKLFVGRETTSNWGRAYMLHEKTEVSANVFRTEEFYANLAGACFKAYLAAFTTETNFEEMIKFVQMLMEPSLMQLQRAPESTFSSQDFHERLVKLGLPLPEYVAEDLKRDGHPEFTVRCIFRGNVIGTGTARTKQVAKRLAAEEGNKTSERKLKNLKDRS